jgi:hypothetical protein
MHAIRARQIESTVVAAASALFAAAVAFACLSLARALANLAPVSLGALTAACALLAFVACRQMLAAIDGAPPTYSVNPFDVSEIEPMPAGEELVLTDADRVDPAPLELDDVLAELPADSRVVRLFDPRSMPTPGQLRARIDDHLRGAKEPVPAPDASQDLFDALAELRRSLR